MRGKSVRSKAIMKLDAIFSKYIRRRDCGYGYAPCISCGKLITYDTSDCGHYENRQHMATRYDEKNCNAQCRDCLTPDALILTSELRWIKLGDIQVGQEILAFEESATKRKTSRRYEVGKVTSLERQLAPVYEVELMNGDKVKTTADHMWLARRGKTSGFQWMKTEDLWVNSRNLKGHRISGAFKEDVSSTVCKPFKVVRQDKSYEAGWLAGMLDADGHITQQRCFDKRNGSITYGLRVGISQSEAYPDICENIERLLAEYSDNRVTCRQEIKGASSIKKRVKCFTYLITGTNVEKIEFLQKIRPNKLSKLNLNNLGKMRSQYDTQVKSISFVGEEEIIAMETSTRTFIANGYAMHNCNRFKEGNIQGYRRGLIKKYGESEVEKIEIRRYNLSKLSVPEIEMLYKHYKGKLADLENTLKQEARGVRNENNSISNVMEISKDSFKER